MADSCIGHVLVKTRLLFIKTRKIRLNGFSANYLAAYRPSVLISENCGARRVKRQRAEHRSLSWCGEQSDGASGTQDQSP